MKINVWKTCFIILIILLLYPMRASAETYAGEIPKVPENKTETIFCFTFSDTQDYEVTLISPAGEYQNVSASATKEVRIPVEETIDGTYAYKIYAEVQDFTYEVCVINSDKIVAKVGESNPSVAENVSALQIWFENGELIASWVYQGKVNLTVTDPAKMNRLANEKAYTQNKYRLTIPEGTDSVQFYIVPSKDSKITGSGLTYTLDVVREVNVELNFPSQVLVNWDRLLIPVNVKNEGLTVKAYVNNFTIGESNCSDNKISPVLNEELSSGEQEITVPLVSVTNNVVLAFIDKKGNASLYTKQYTRDMQAPAIEMKKLSINNEIYKSGIYTDKETVLITGTVKDEIATGMIGNVRSFSIDGATVELDENGRFTYEYCLSLIGMNEIELDAIDESGNETKIPITIERRVKSKKELMFSVLSILVMIILVLGAIYLCVVINQRAGNPVQRLFEKIKEARLQKTEDEEDDEYFEMQKKEKPVPVKENENKQFREKKKHGKSVAELRREIEAREREKGN